MAWLTARAVMRNGITRISGSSAKPIRWTKPSPQNAAMTPVSVGRSAPRQSWKYIQRSIHSKQYVTVKIQKTSPA